MQPDELPTKEELQSIGNLSMPRYKIGLVFPPMNNFKGCVEAIWSAKSKHNIQVYIQPQWISPRPSLAGAWNNGAQEAFDDGCQYAIVCNDDIIFSPDTIDAMVEQYELLRHTDSVIMVTPNNINLQLANPFDIMKYERPDDPFTYSENPNFSCFLISPEYFDKVGKFDENFWPAFWEDNDSHYRAKLLGYKEICTTAAPMVHFGGVSTSLANPNEVNSSASQAYFYKKWGSVKRDLNEAFKTPYNNPALTPKDWIKDYV